MKNSENKGLQIAKGTGYLLGAAITLIMAVVIFILSKNVAVSISAAFPIGVTTGIGLEQRFQGTAKNNDPRSTKTMLVIFSFGIIVFMVFYFSIKFV